MVGSLLTKRPTGRERPKRASGDEGEEEEEAEIGVRFVLLLLLMMMMLGSERDQSGRCRGREQTHGRRGKYARTRQTKARARTRRSCTNLTTARLPLCPSLSVVRRQPSVVCRPLSVVRLSTSSRAESS